MFGCGFKMYAIKHTVLFLNCKFVLVIFYSIMKISRSQIFLSVLLFSFLNLPAQYSPKSWTKKQMREANQWVNKTYRSLSEDEKLGQLFIIALYTNKGEDHISSVRNIVAQEKIGGLILMQDDAAREIQLVNEFQEKSKVPLLIGMDAEWGLFQRIAAAHKLPWAITLGAIQDKSLITEMSAKIAEDSKRMGIHWDFAPVVDVNTNPLNPIIGNRSFGSEVENVIKSAEAYAKGLQDNQILAAVKHFPGHGDTNTDSHLDLPEVTHSRARLDSIELAPFQALMDKGIGGVMIAHLYVPALQNGEKLPASLSYNIVTRLLKEKMGYKGLIITDALNMGAVANRYKPGEVDALAFKAGNDIMLFSDGVQNGKRLIKEALQNHEIPKRRLKESVKKILLTKYYLGLSQLKPQNPDGINAALNNESHRILSEKLYANALTLLKDEKQLLPLHPQKKYYYLPLEEAPHDIFYKILLPEAAVTQITADAGQSIPKNSVVIVGLHKDNSTAYKPYAISESSKKILADLARDHKVILTVFGSPYALRDIDITPFSTVLVSYENNDDSMKATAKAFLGKTRIWGRLPVTVNNQLPAGSGIVHQATKPNEN